MTRHARARIRRKGADGIVWHSRRYQDPWLTPLSHIYKYDRDPKGPNKLTPQVRAVPLRESHKTTRHEPSWELRREFWKSRRWSQHLHTLRERDTVTSSTLHHKENVYLVGHKVQIQTHLSHISVRSSEWITASHPDKRRYCRQHRRRTTLKLSYSNRNNSALSKAALMHAILLQHRICQMRRRSESLRPVECIALRGKIMLQDTKWPNDSARYRQNIWALVNSFELSPSKCKRHMFNFSMPHVEPLPPVFQS